MGLCARINLYKFNSADVFQMDGFHYDDRALENLGLLVKKGRPILLILLVSPPC